MKLSPAIAREFTSAGVLRAALNLDNPVLARSSSASEEPAGIGVDLAREFARCVGAEVEFLPFATPNEAAVALASGAADIGFLANHPERSHWIRFTQPYLEIDAAYLVREDSKITASVQVDAPGTCIVVAVGSSCHVYLHRHLKHARVLQAPSSQGLADLLLASAAVHVAAGMTLQLQADVERLRGVRLLPGPFLAMPQAMALPRGRSPRAAAALEDFVAEHKRSGFIAEALERHGIQGARALP